MPFFMVPGSAKYWDIDASKNASWSYYYYTGTYPHMQQYTIKGRLGSKEGSVEVPAGIFSQCAVCVISSSVSGKSEYYLAPNVGIVKLVTPTETYELSSFTVVE